jgi:hypothetical protein
MLGTMPQALPEGIPEKVANVIGGMGVNYGKLEDQLIKTAGLTSQQAISSGKMVTVLNY